MKRFKPIFILVILTVFILTTFAGSLNVIVEINDYQVTKKGAEDVITFEGNSNSSLKGGEPKLPGKHIQILLPPGAKFISVDVMPGISETKQNINILPTTPLIPLNGDQKFIKQFIDRAKDIETKIYSVNEFFPKKNNKVKTTLNFLDIPIEDDPELSQNLPKSSVDLNAKKQKQLTCHELPKGHAHKDKTPGVEYPLL